VLQTIVPDELRGRVASLYVMSFLGLSPVGALMAGWMAERIGAPHALALNGLLAMLAAGLYLQQMPAIRRAIAPVYRELGILPPADD
jgi:MFS family permease